MPSFCPIRAARSTVVCPGRRSRSAPGQRVTGPDHPGESVLGRPGRGRSGGPSCDARRPRACRTGGGGRRDRASASARPSRCASRRSPVPSRLTIAAGPCGAGSPRGSPQIARMCCSNWLVGAPSIVQWPLLWTRGASSFTTSEPSARRNISTVRVPITPRDLSEVDGQLAGAGGLLGRDRGRSRHDGLEQDPGVVPVAAWLERHGSPVEPAGDHDRQLAGEVELPLEQQAGGLGRAFERLPGRGDIGRPGQADLASAVVATDRCLESKRQTKLCGRCLQLGPGPDGPPRRDKGSGRLEERTFGEPVLGDLEGPQARSEGPPLGHGPADRGGNVLELVRHDVRRVCQPDRGGHVVVAADDQLIGRSRRRDRPDPGRGSRSGSPSRGQPRRASCPAGRRR